MTQTASNLPLFLIEPRPRLRAAITHHLSLHGMHVEPFEALNEFTDRNFENGIVLVNDDLSLASQLARWIQKDGSKLVHIAYAVELSASRVLRAVNEGAINFIEWPADKDRLIEILNDAAAQLRPEIEARRSRPSRWCNFGGGRGSSSGGLGSDVQGLVFLLDHGLG